VAQLEAFGVSVCETYTTVYVHPTAGLAGHSFQDEATFVFEVF
jgi:hypothetical protein